jgi:nitrogen fixation/metabolism regulation signal transduction histidine kinase
VAFAEIESQSEDTSRRQRRITLLVLAVMIVVLLALLISQTSFNFLSPDDSQETLVFSALSAIVFLLFVALSLVLLRNLLKLYAERRGGVLGSKFRTKMVLGALLLSFTPVLFLFLFAYGLMNNSVNRWFSQPVEELRASSTQVARELSEYVQSNASAEAQSITEAPETQKSYATQNFSGLLNILRQHDASLQDGFALALLDGEPVAAYHLPAGWPLLRKNFGPRPAEIRRLDWAGTQYAIGSRAMGNHGEVIVALPLPRSFVTTLAKMDASQERYQQLRSARRQLRQTYILALLLITAAVLFAATWLSLYLARLATRPISALAEATQEISKGNLEYRVDVAAYDEFGQLVDSFNRMAGELESNRKQIEASSHELADANVNLERRTKQLATLLENIPTGVLSLDVQLRASRSNPALLMQLGPGTAVTPGSSLREVFGTEAAEEMTRLLRKADRMGTVTAQMELNTKRGLINVALTVASIKMDRQRLGYVLVFEDFTELLRAQKQAAWREVARRVAHEIKNPLTPIALSAERIRRHLERGSQPDEASLAIMHGCAETISGAVETVRTLVDEFSTLARFPAAQPTPNDLNPIVEAALQTFEGRLDDVRIRTDLSPDLPAVMADPLALKRAIANLVDNAAEAMQGAHVRELHVSTAPVDGREAVEIVVADTGHGVTPEVKEKLFLPYFSTKRRGTGLGLPIVSRIVQEHNGNIRVEENDPVGARFIIELPFAIPESQVQPSPSVATA